MEYPILIKSFSAATAFIVLSWALKSITLYSKRVRLAHRAGCEPAPNASNWRFTFGLASVLEAMRSIRENRHNISLKQKLDLYGSTFEDRPLGSRGRIFTIDPQNIQSVFAKDFASWGVQPVRLPAFEQFVGAGIMTTDHAIWEHSRALLRPCFSRTQISDFSGIQAHTDRLMEKVPTDGSTVDLQPLFALFALDSSTEFLFGKSVMSLAPNKSTMNDQSFLEAFNFCQMTVGKRLKLSFWWKLMPDRRFRECCLKAKRFAGRFADEALSRAKKKLVKTEGRYTLVDELAKETNDSTVIRNQLLNVFLPAHDASAVTLTNVFFHLARNPTVWKKLKDEVRRETSSCGVTFESLKSIKYLQQVLNETLRLNPSIGSVTRAGLRDTTLPRGGGIDGKSSILVKEGDLLSTSLYALHRRRDIYGEDADEFSPERWEHLRPPPWTYLPFGGGPRVCPGQQLGLTEVCYVLVRILRSCATLENRDPVLEYVEDWKLSTESKNGAKVAFTREQKHSI